MPESVDSRKVVIRGYAASITSSNPRSRLCCWELQASDIFICGYMIRTRTGGTAYSSESLILRLPITTAHIDGSPEY